MTCDTLRDSPILRPSNSAMPPSLRLSKACSAILQTSHSSAHLPLAPFLFPCVYQTRNASILGSLSDNSGAYNKRKRVGRGPASGYGKTSGRGHKGQKQHGKVPRGFNGGQTKDEVVAGPRGFTNNFSIDLSKVNLDKVQQWINQGRLDPSKPITLKELARSRCIHGVKEGVKLLARNAEALTTPVNIIVSRASAAAIAAVEKAGGSVITRYYTPMAIQRIMKGETSPIASLDAIGGPLEAILPMSEEARPGLVMQEGPDATLVTSSGRIPALPAFKYRLPDPIGRKDIEYYRDPAHRGYLVHTIKEGEGPSLYWKTPGSRKKNVVGDAKKREASANKLW